MSVLSWGCSLEGQLGLPGLEGDITSTATPTEVPSLAGKPVAEISCGLRHTCILLTDGTLMTCGANDRGQLGQERTQSGFALVAALETVVVSQVACRNDHTLAVTDRGQVLAWGRDDRGQCGLASGERGDKRKPRILKSLSSSHVVLVACGSMHSMALTRDGQIFTWGDNSFGQLGVREIAGTPFSDRPTPLASLQGIPISKIACGGWHSFVLSVSGALFGWGKNNCGQLGLGDTEDRACPTLLHNLQSQRIQYVTCGQNHTAVLTATGGLFLFGQGSEGQLGHGSTQNEVNPRKVMELMGSQITQVACGRQHTLVFEGQTGRLYSFGQGAKGQLGQDRKGPWTSPSLVPGPWARSHDVEVEMNGGVEGYAVKALFVGGDHCFCVTSRISDQQRPLDFRKTEPSRQPAVLNEILIKEACSANFSSSPTPKPLKMLEMIFSSPSCLNASFLKEEDGQQHTDHAVGSHGLDLDTARSAFEPLSHRTDILQMICDVITKHLFPTLQQGHMASPHPLGECLRLYLTLMECPALSHPGEAWCRRTIGLLAQALLGLRGEAESTLGRWWSGLQQRHLNRILSVHKDCVLSILRTRQMSSPDDRQTQWTCMMVLKRLNAVNVSSGEPLPYYLFHIPDIGRYINMQDDFLEFYKNNVLGNAGFVVNTFCDFPFVFDAEMKASLLHLDALLQMQLAMENVQRRNLANMFLSLSPDSPCLVLCVSRENLVASAVDQLQSLGAQQDLKKPLKVIFIGEEAVDAGGVQKEFFMLIMRELLDPKFGMFRYFKDSGKIWFNSKSFEDKQMFRLVGLICGLAIYNRMIVSLPFPLALHKKLLNRPTTLEDFIHLEPHMGSNLQEMLDYRDDDAEAFRDIYPLTFQIDEENFGDVETSELLPGGAEKEVTLHNRDEYVAAYVDYVLNVSVEEQFGAFSDGFLEVCGGHVLNFFHPQELMAMVVGNEDFNWEELEETVTYKGEYSAGHPTIKFFWQVFRDLSVEDKRKFLIFLTGSDHVPIQGWKSLEVIIQPVRGGEDYFPVAHTCFNLLDLPIYTSKDLLREKLLAAIQHTEGFTLV